MKLNEYMTKLQEFIMEHPKAMDMDVITSIDDEGNGYNLVYGNPTLGIFRNVDEFISHPLDLKDEGSTEDDFNAVCLN